jgi:hypothetical protein
MPQVCFCHGVPRGNNDQCVVKKRERQARYVERNREKRRAQQREYWTIRGWGRRRERSLDRQLRKLTQEAEDLGSA